MTDLSPVKKNIQIEETSFRGPVSESFAKKLGSSVNFINYRQHSEKQFFINGEYNSIATPNIGVDGMVFFEFDAEIIDVWMFCINAGSSGTTELDVELCTSSGGSFSSIFSTTPKIASTAGNYSYVNIGGSGTGLTAPVMFTTNVSAGSALRINILQAQSGSSCAGTGIVIHYRPR